MFDHFMAHLHRGGQFAYYHLLPARISRWHAVSEPAPINLANIHTNIYFSIHPSTIIPPANAHGEVREPRFVRAHLSTIAAINCLYAEFDAKDYGDIDSIIAHIEALPVPAPSAIVCSGGGIHAYWLLDEPYMITNEDRLQAAKIIQHKWVLFVGGDKGVHDLCRIFRVPGSLNYKYDPPRSIHWLWCDLDCVYPIRTLTACLPPEIEKSPPKVAYHDPSQPDIIGEYNNRHNVGTVLEQRGYTWAGRRKMLSPYSTTGQAGVTIDHDQNRAFVHHGSDPLHDGYWKRPFDVVRILDCNGDLKQTIKRLRSDVR
jgi:hypothetical protein